jgi:murein DD-endopeptidase MepM/ murein hydrolase activator NlpD
MAAPRSSRFTAILIGWLLVLAVSPAIAAQDEATDDPPGTLAVEEPVFDPTDPEQVFREIVFPLVGSSTYSQGFGACRDGCTRDHKGIDILSNGWKGVPVVAAHDGIVAATYTESEMSGCALEIGADDGWSTVYVHLNTDLPGTDLAGAPCFAPGIEVGSRVSAGTLIGWVGDSGNAEDTVPNLHFEIRNPDGISVDPWVSLIDAKKVDYEWVSPADVLELAKSIVPAIPDSAYLVRQDDLDRLALGDPGTFRFESPIVPYDPMDLGPALAVLRGLAPERIIILADDAPAFVDDLYGFAPIVAVADLPGAAPSGEPTREPTDTPGPGAANETTDPATYLRLDADRFTILIAGRVRSVGATLNSTIDTIGADHPIIVLETDRRSPSGIGAAGPSRPDVGAHRNYLWWNTATGWQFSESLDNAPDPGFAYLHEIDVTPWTLAFLSSLASAPPMPVWFFQSTSRATRSL